MRDGTPKLTKSYEAVIADLNAIHSAKWRKRHPLWTGLMSGTLSKPQVAEFLRQCSVIALYNHFYNGPLYVSCPNAEWRRRMAEVVYEEGTGQCTRTLYLRMAEAFGISRKEIYATKFCGGP